MDEQPADIWLDGMDEEALRSWLEIAWRQFDDFWRDGDAERHASHIVEDVVYVSRCRLDIESYQGRSTYLERMVQARELMPFMRREFVHVEPPNRDVTRVTYSDEAGNEIARLVAVRYESGLIAEVVTFDDGREIEAISEAIRMGAQSQT